MTSTKPNAVHHYFAEYVAFALVLAVLYYLRNLDFLIDDSYITYRYAFNFKEGYGLSFNPGENYYGTTAAGYAILLGGVLGSVSWLQRAVGLSDFQELDIPQVAVALSSASLIIISITLASIYSGRGWMA